jgi:hypothetical protein
MAIMTVIGVFAPRGSARVVAAVKLVVGGAIRAPGPRTVPAGLRGLGKSADAPVQHDHRVLNRAHWSALDASRRRLELRLDGFVPPGPVVMGRDETLERRRGERSAAQGVYRAPVRSAPAPFVKARGVRWVWLMALARLPWGARVWALPLLTGLAPAERSDPSQGRQPHSILERARQRGRLVRRWGPSRALVVVGDSTYAAREGLDAVRERACVLTRWRLDAALYAPAPPRQPQQSGRPRQKGMRRPTLAQRRADPTTPWKLVTAAPWYGQQARRGQIASATAVWDHAGLPPVPMRWGLLRDPAGAVAPHARLATTRALDPRQILSGCSHRWRLATTCEAARAPLGFDTPRQWNDRSGSRTTPAVCGLYAIVPLAAAPLRGERPAPVRTTAWDPQPPATFSDTIALVRRWLWPADHVPLSSAPLDGVNIPRAL